MKKLLIIASAFILIQACKKESQKTIAPVQALITCTINLNGLLDTTWLPVNNSFAKLKFSSQGSIYYQNGVSNGVWSQKGCDSIYVVRTSGSFYYRITYLHPDTMKLINPTFGNLTYHH